MLIAQSIVSLISPQHFRCAPVNSARPAIAILLERRHVLRFHRYPLAHFFAPVLRASPGLAMNSVILKRPHLCTFYTVQLYGLTRSL